MILNQKYNVGMDSDYINVTILLVGRETHLSHYHRPYISYGVSIVGQFMHKLRKILLRSYIEDSEIY